MSERIRELLRLGTSSFTAPGWETSFYPRGTNQRDYLKYYATQFDTLEIDSTFYGIPAPGTVQKWYERTPEGFLFALKCPQEITHDKVLAGADEKFTEFLRAVEPLREKLGVILLQFPYFARGVFASGEEFVERIRPFLEKLPKEPRFALEIRNKGWITEGFLDLLRQQRIALALIDYPRMPRALEYAETLDPITTDFTYIRWLGDRKAIEAVTMRWEKTIADRSGQLGEWAALCRRFFDRGIRVFGFANNHYGGYAPDTLRLVAKLLDVPMKEASAPLGTTGKLFSDL